MSTTAPAVTELLVAAPAYVVHGGSGHATACLLPEQAAGPLDGALRLYESDRVVPGHCAQLHDFGTVAVAVARLEPGRHTVTVAYTGGSHYAASVSAPFSVLVLPASTVTELALPVDVRPGSRLRVTVRATDSAAVPCGRVRLYDGARLICETTVDAGSFILPQLEPGTHRLFAAYAGSATHRPSETRLLPVAVGD